MTREGSSYTHRIANLSIQLQHQLRRCSTVQCHLVAAPLHHSQHFHKPAPEQSSTLFTDRNLK